MTAIIKGTMNKRTIRTNIIRTIRTTRITIKRTIRTIRTTRMKSTIRECEMFEYNKFCFA